MWYVSFKMCLCYDDINWFLCVITLVEIMTKILIIENPFLSWLGYALYLYDPDQ